ncbi:dihydrolipoamide acetyltransferase family protein [Alicyclobacillus macrosporangiidus]|uniref:Dihydrolipoamide acetyltransferase component of pyruvate dehydrogenase complex n=1 Tax=Alicyclobacillus macrosporangiidus TaxID=392015 RepID=A0A1I7KMV9_9BACL|nr:dihydrolipoamide acetyltransferase family protein [Alicyclobacillus macrosporangiidus]SFU98759.1 2-oxoisovalerate dehydrogenase E2 component (dihydrolipoyl transacylase) [Alicyclobacillus macrosporangiidus]
MPDVKMPQLGESVTEGTIEKWLKRVGEPVAKYEPLAEVVTDKVRAEIPSDFSGVLAEILVPEGETVGVGTVICRIAEDGTDTGGEGRTGEAPDRETVREERGRADAEGRAGGSAGGTAPTGRLRYSPAVLHLAREHGIDLEKVTGTGEGGRITRKDVLAYIDRMHEARAGEAAAEGERVAEPATLTERPAARRIQAQDDVEVIPASPVRRIIARRMVASKHEAPHAWTMVEVDASGLVALRERVKADFERREGVPLTYLPFFIKAAVEALKQFPTVNAAWIDDAIHVHRRIHVSIAVATDEGLQVPVIRDADRLSIAGLAHAVHDLAVRARAGRLTLADVEGGTFTVNNTGAFGSVLSQPILNVPQAAILSVEAIVKRPVVIDDMIAIRSMVNLCLSLDHRVLDGWVAGQFLRAIKERVQSYGEDTALY